MEISAMSKQENLLKMTLDGQDYNINADGQQSNLRNFTLMGQKLYVYIYVIDMGRKLREN